MNYFLRKLPVFVGLALMACKTTPDPDPQPQGPGSDPILTPAPPTELGKPVGVPTIQTIGPAGGTLTTADGKLALTFPKNAVGKDTPVTVQEVENTAPNGSGSSYRIEGLEITVSEPVIAVYRPRLEARPGEVTGAAPGNVALARQQASGTWRLSQLAGVDPAKGTVTAKIRRVSREAIAFIEQYRLQPETATLVPGERLPMSITFVDFQSLGTGTDEDLLLPMPGIAERDIVRKMLVNGKAEPSDYGVFWYKKDAGTSAWLEYTAPDRVPVKDRRLVALTVELYNPAVRAFLALVANVNVVPAGELKIGGNTYDDPVVFALEVDGVARGLHVTLKQRFDANPTAKVASLSVTLPFAGAGTYTLTAAKATEWEASATEENGKTWAMSRRQLPSHKEVYGPVTVTITEYGGNGKPIAGTISGTLHSPNHLSEATISVSARFRVAQFGQ